MTKRYDHDIIELNARDTFCKAKINSFPIDKVQLSFVKFDPSTNKSLQAVDAYVSFEEMKVLCADILSGRIAAMAKAELAKGAAWPAAVWQSMGGTDADKCKERGLRTDGKAMSRIVKIIPGKKMPFLLQVDQGPGESNAKGLIVPKYSSPEVRIMVPLSADMIKAFALLTDSHINAWFTYQFMSGGYDSTYQKPE